LIKKKKTETRLFDRRFFFVLFVFKRKLTRFLIDEQEEEE